VTDTSELVDETRREQRESSTGSRIGGIAVLIAVGLAIGAGTLLAVDSVDAREAIDPAWRELPPSADGPALVAEPGHVGEFVAQCPVSHRALDDPIVHPGQAGVSHSHDFFGNEDTDADSTIASLRGGDTTCHIGGDTAAYWAPTLFRDGEPVTPELGSAYYRGVVGSDVTRLVAPPPGLVMIAGDADATSAQPVDVVGWGCDERGELSSAPPSCSNRSRLTLHVLFPDCWDGEHLDADDHQAHVAYSDAGACRSSHPVAMTQLAFVIRYPISGDPGELHLASGSLETAHADFMNAWDQSILAAETRFCVNRRVTCSV
jgi:hypothetical protein